MRVWKKRRIYALLVLTLVFGLLTGCQNKADVGDKDTLIFATHADPGTLAPAGSNARQAARIKWNIYETLCNLGYDGQLHPVLAQSWELIDSTHWKFYLRDGVTFHNGDVMTPQDVLFSFKLAAAGTFAGASGKNMDLENAIINEDENSLTIALFEPDSTFLYSVASYCITSQRAYEDAPDGMVNQPVGSGPYICEEYVVGDSVTLSRFKDYWGKQAQIERVIYRVIPESSQRAIELETGGVDFIFEMDQTDASRLNGDPHFQIVTQNSVINECLFYNNWEGSPFSSKLVRQAVSYAINAGDFHIITKYIIPNALAPTLVQMTMGVASAITMAATLSFIGLGVRPPAPEWGAMLSGARNYFRDYPHLVIVPGIFIMLTVLALNVLGDSLRDALDPKQNS